MSRERQNGTILKGIGGFYYVACAGRVVECKASGRLRLGDLLPLAGDHVEIASAENPKELVARGLAYISSDEMASLIGKTCDDSDKKKHIAVHRDNLAMR